MKQTKTLIWHIYPAFLVILVLTLVALLVYVSASLKQFYLEHTEHQLEQDARAFQRLLQPDMTNRRTGENMLAGFSEPESRTRETVYQEIDRWCKSFGEILHIRITVILPSGRVIGDTMEDPAVMNNHADRPEIQAAFEKQVGTSTRYSYTLEKDMMYVAIPLHDDDRVVGVIRTSTSVSSVSRWLYAMLQKIFLGSLVAAVIAGIVSFLVSYRITRPLHTMKEGASRFAQGDLNHRLYVSGSQEVILLADALNRMASQLHERISTVTNQRAELEAMLSSMVEAVIVVDPEKHLMRCNRAAGQLFKFSIETAQSRHIQEVIRNVDIQRFIGTTLATQTPVEDVIVLPGNGKETFLRAHGTLLRPDDVNGVTGVLLVFHNITRLKQLENMRREFVANVSHELKTPITSITGFVETLRDGAIHDPDNSIRFLDIIAKNASRLNTIIEDLLSLSKIEQEEEKGRLTLTRQPLNDVVSTAVIVCENSAQEKDITITLTCAPELSARINPALLEQAVVNLLDNAIKYSEQHSDIHVEAARQDEQVVMTVQDFGCGIPREHLSRLFERFYRVDKARSRKLGGTGLGLAIVKHIVHAHHGTITVESQPGKGSTFSIFLPAA